MFIYDVNRPTKCIKYKYITAKKRFCFEAKMIFFLMLSMFQLSYDNSSPLRNCKMPIYIIVAILPCLMVRKMGGVTQPIFALLGTISYGFQLKKTLLWIQTNLVIHSFYCIFHSPPSSYNQARKSTLSRFGGLVRFFKYC